MCLDTYTLLRIQDLTYRGRDFVKGGGYKVLSADCCSIGYCISRGCFGPILNQNGHKK